MLTKIKFSNINSFKEESEINFEFNGKVPEDIKKGRQATNILCIKGANSSGKTNIFKVLSTLSRVCGFGAKIDNDERLYVDTYFGNSDPAKIYVEFIFFNTSYKYFIMLNDKCVIYEKLEFKEEDDSRFKVAYERENEKLLKTSPQLKELSNIQIKPNSSVMALLTTLKFSNDMTIIENARVFFAFMLINASYSGHAEIKSNILSTTKKYFNNNELFSSVKEIIKIVDPSIFDISLQETTDSEGKVSYYPIFVFENNNTKINMPLRQVSSGIRKLYETLEIYFLVLKTGGILALDEFDIHLHPHILPVLLALFDDSSRNKTNAQLIFSTHNSEIIDILGKYRVVIVNKENNESFCYRLDELLDKPLRNDRTISSLYIDGKLGGVPTINSIDLKSLQFIKDL